jgi:replicative DNA helicase
LITESFLNSCFSLLLNKKTIVKRSKALYRDVLEVITFSEAKDTVDVPISVKNKLDLLKIITNMLSESKSVENIFDSVVFSEKFKQHKDFLDMMIHDDVNVSVFQSTLEQVRLRKKIGALFKNYDELDKVLTSIKDGSFDSIDSLVGDYESTIKTLYSNMMESNRSQTIEASSSLDLIKDDYSHVIEMIKKKYDKSNSTPSGFDMFDGDILNGGYEPSRLYIYGGGSGAGKSTILNNSIYKSAEKEIIPGTTRFPTDQEVNRVYVYVTLENTIEEALMRTYMPMFDTSLVKMLKQIGGDNPIPMKDMIATKLKASGSTIVMKYFPAMSISPVDLMGVLDDVIDIYGKDSIAGLYVDYLDLLKTDTKYDVYRMELGHITLSLKTLAVQYNIPVITASQLGRSAYRVTDSRELGVDQMSESIKKVEHADFVMLLAKDPVNDNIVHGKVGKNRAGKANVAVDFHVDFEKFKFDSSANVLSNDNRPDNTTKSSVTAKAFEFQGMTI